jgi:hypothetical protein
LPAADSYAFQQCCLNPTPDNVHISNPSSLSVTVSYQNFYTFAMGSKSMEAITRIQLAASASGS